MKKKLIIAAILNLSFYIQCLENEELNQQLIQTLESSNIPGEQLINKVIKLITKGANINAINMHKKTPLMIAAGKGFENIVELLIERNAKINTQDLSGWTALMHASYRGFKDIVELLLKYGADITLRNDNYQTAYEIALKHKHNEIAEIIKSYDWILPNLYKKSVITKIMTLSSE